MTFTRWLDDKKWLFYEKGLQVIWNRLHALAAGTTVGTFVAGAAMIGNIDMDAATNPGLTAAVGPGSEGAGQQNLPASTAGQIDPSATAVDRVPPTQFRT